MEKQVEDKGVKVGMRREDAICRSSSLFWGYYQLLTIVVSLCGVSVLTFFIG